MAEPFLSQLSDHVQREREKTAQAVFDYYQSIKRLRPYLENNVPSERLPRVAPRPEILNWLERIERWGLPNPGTWLDQPALFLAQVEGAMDGKRKALEQVIPQADPFKDAPNITAR